MDVIYLKETAAADGISARVAPVERLGSLPSMDTGYLLPGTRSVISLMMPLDKSIVRGFLAKEIFEDYQRHETDTYRRLYWTGKKIAALLKSEGYDSVVPEPNLDYRFKDEFAYRAIPYPVRQGFVDWLSSASGRLVTSLKRALVVMAPMRNISRLFSDLYPDFSARYGAVAAGHGVFGWSGNVLNPQHGATVLFESVLTRAALKADPMLDEELCDRCMVCTMACQSGFIGRGEADHAEIGGRVFEHSRKADNLRCVLVCGGFCGMSLHRGWSTWSPGRFSIPDRDEELREFFVRFLKENAWKHNYYSKVLSDLVFHSEYGFIRKPFHRFDATCGNCQLVCWRDVEDRKENLKILTTSGTVKV